MLNREVTDYIVRRLKAGDNPSAIATTIHAWGWGTDTISVRNNASPSPSHSHILTMTVSITMVFLLVISGVWLNRSSMNISKTQSIAHAVVNSETIPAQSPAITRVPTIEEPAHFGLKSTASASSLTTTDLIQDEPASSSPELNIRENSVTVATTNYSVGKSEYTIVLIGDSMVDTLESHLPSLSKKLEAKYHSKFKLYNYGVGAQNVEMGLAKFNRFFSYKDREYPPITELKPDIIIIGSFAYNPFSPFDINKYWLNMAELAKNAQATGADVYFLADIAPVKETFGVGSLDWTIDTRVSHSQKIIDQLNSFVALSNSLKIPLIDVYTVSQVKGQYGNGTYTDAHDGIHANDAGKMLVINQIAKDLVVK